MLQQIEGMVRIHLGVNATDNDTINFISEAVHEKMNEVTYKMVYDSISSLKAAGHNKLEAFRITRNRYANNTKEPNQLGKHPYLNLKSLNDIYNMCQEGK